MRVFAAIAVVALCAGVACAGGQYFKWPSPMTSANSFIDRDAGLGHFRVQLQVPPEPNVKSDQTLVLLVGTMGMTSPISASQIRAGMALIWNAEHRWLASVGSVSCTSPYGVDCRYLSLDGWDLKVEPGDLVMLNITNLPKKYVIGYEVSVPFKGTTTGEQWKLMIDQPEVTGVGAEIVAINLTSREQFPTGETRLLKTAYSAAINEAKEIPLTWKIYEPSKYGQKFRQENDWLVINWQ